MGPKEKAAIVAENYNKTHPEKPIDKERMYRLMIYEIYPLILDKFPEFASSVDFIRNPLIDEGGKRWVRKPKPEEVVTPPAEDISDDDEKPYIPLEERISPMYRIDPVTGERTLISLNMRRVITAAQEAWCHDLLTFLSIERYSESRRIIKSNAKR